MTQRSSRKKPAVRPGKAKSRTTTTAAKERVRDSKSKPAKKRAAPTPSLGRPLITAEEKLYLLFKEEYDARQVFEFLRVETVGDLEKFSPEQIVKLLSKPIRTTVARIREKLAEKNRHLLDDTAFAVEFLARNRTPG